MVGALVFVGVIVLFLAWCILKIGSMEEDYDDKLEAWIRKEKNKIE